MSGAVLFSSTNNFPPSLANLIPNVSHIPSTSASSSHPSILTSRLAGNAECCARYAVLNASSPFLRISAK